MAAPTSQLPLAGRVAIVTGSSRGIGRAIASHLHSLGARVVVNYASSSAEADGLVAELNGRAGSSLPTAIAVKANVADPDQVKHLFDRAEKEFGSLVHIVVNNAGVILTNYPTLANTTAEEFDYTFNVNTKGAFLCSREAANRLARDGGGRIINITTSVMGSLLPGYSVYTASKAAVETMTKILAKELKGTRITANCVAPGPVRTELFSTGKSEGAIKAIAEACPLGRIGEPEDIMHLVGFLASDAGEWVNGQDIKINGGLVI